MASKTKRSLMGSILFYTLYLLLLVAFFVGMSYVMSALKGWLQRFEDSQPKYKCQEVFDEIFANPDWEEIYLLAGIEDTMYEGKTQFATYMQNLCAGKTISYTETSAGLSGDKKYIVKVGEEKIATFTLTPDETQENEALQLPGAESGVLQDIQGETDITQWHLGEVEVFFTRKERVTVQTVGDHTVYINGVALTDSAKIRTLSSTVVEKYLPEGLYGLRTATYSIDGLLLPPTVTVLDGNGVSQSLLYDAEKGCYSETPPTFEMTPAEEALLLDTAQTYCKFMISAAKTADLKKYFDTSSQIYQNIRESDTWMQSYKGYTFENVSVSQFYRYSENLFSAKVSLSLNVTRTNGTVKTYSLDSFFFFTKQVDGSYLATEMTNVDISKTTETVRMTYMVNGEILDSQFVQTDEKTLTPPTVTPVDGSVFSGWAKETVDDSGNITLTILFSPDETGLVYLPEDYVAEPLTLYAVFESKGA